MFYLSQEQINITLRPTKNYLKTEMVLKVTKKVLVKHTEIQILVITKKQ